MKLNNQQISALADKICDNIKVEVDKQNKGLNTEDKFKIWKKDNSKLVDIITNSIKYCKLWKENTDPSYYVESVAGFKLEEELKREFKKTIKFKEAPYISTIKQDIILETIECENLDSIITKLVDKYTK